MTWNQLKAWWAAYRESPDLFEDLRAIIILVGIVILFYVLSRL